MKCVIYVLINTVYQLCSNWSDAIQQKKTKRSVQYIAWHWLNFVSYMCPPFSPPSCRQTAEKFVTVILLTYALLISYWPCKHFLKPKWFSLHLNNTTNIHPSIPQFHVLPTKWRSYRDHRLRDITSSYVFNDQVMWVWRTVL